MKQPSARIACALFLSFLLFAATATSIAQTRRTYRRINFQRGRTTAVIKGRVPPDGFNYYYLRARRGQTMIAHITSARGTAVFTIIGRQSDRMLDGAAGVTDWTGELPASEDYELHVGAAGGRGDTYTLEVTIR